MIGVSLLQSNGTEFSQSSMRPDGDEEILSDAN